MYLKNCFVALSFVSVGMLSGCEEYTTLEPTSEIVFLAADSNFRFQNSAFPKGTQVELIGVEGGRQAVWVNTTQASTAAGGFGAPVALISVQNKNGMMLDENFCTTGDMLVNSAGITTVHAWDNYVARESITKGVCFQPVE